VGKVVVTRFHLVWKSGCDLLSVPGKGSTVHRFT